MAKDSSERRAPDAVAALAEPPAGRIIAAEALRAVLPYPLDELSGSRHRPVPLRARDLDNEVGRAAYALGRRRGWDEGHRAGREQGHGDGVRSVEAAQGRSAAETARDLQQLAAGFRQELGRLEGDLAESVVTLAIDIARQVVRRELTLDPQALLPAANEALRVLAEGAGRLELCVNPDDAQVLRTHLEAQATLAPWWLREDPAVRRGGCRIEADTGIVDASIEVRWDTVLAVLGRTSEGEP